MRMMHAFAAILIVAGSGCDTVADPVPVQTGPSGVYVVNEGAFRSSNAELSFIDPDKGTASGSVFSGTNPGRTLGDVANHAALAFGRLYVVLNNSRKIEVIEPGTHRWLQTISLTTSPRQISVVSAFKAYVTNMDSTVSILDLVGGTEARRLTVGTFPEAMVVSGSRLYVLNGGFGYGTTISVVDILSDSVVQTIPTPSGPSYGVTTSAGLVHVSCTGYQDFFDPLLQAPGSVITLEGASGTVVDTVWLSGPGGKIAADGTGALYVLGPGSGTTQAVWKLSGGSSPIVLSSTLVAGSYYGIGIHSARNELYLSEAGDFVSNGRVQVRSQSGALIREYTSGIGVAPNGFVVLP